ncbi:MAG: metal/formaldehyde-sensitive transcriptional repressor [Acidobacteria bacterium]|nr:metal/formaldehyde-sensitive transcriptional repressor [Acidobacteriota bacterium]
MSHTIRDREKLLQRVRRIRGQVEGVERALEEEKEPFHILQTVAACRGALNGLMAEIIEGHVRLHVLDEKQTPSPQQAEAVEELMEIIHAFLR